MRRSLIAVPVLALASLALVACGDDDKSSGGGGVRAATAVEGDAFCTAAAAADVAGDSTSVAIDAGDPTGIKSAVDAAVAAAQAAQKLAPTDIAATVDNVVKVQLDIRDLFASNDYDLAAVAQDPAFAEMQADASVDETATELDTYLEDKCGIVAD